MVRSRRAPCSSHAEHHSLCSVIIHRAGEVLSISMYLSDTILVLLQKLRLQQSVKKMVEIPDQKSDPDIDAATAMMLLNTPPEIQAGSGCLWVLKKRVRLGAEVR
ncbi:hypothetical protein EK904_009742 [Melospiza melodia maxima]|nr:hypothetical protein EK904_009742 [Melospiza melodia maxima]